MELLEVERRTGARPGVVATAEPDPFADLVADRLAGQAEVAVDLARHEVGGELAAFDRRTAARAPGVQVSPGWYGSCGGNGELEVHPDVDDHSHRAHRLRAQHPELVRGIVEVPELAHQALGVEGPALGVPRRAGERALVAAQQVGEVADLGDLQVMPGNALVVADRHLAPEREPCLAERRVPRAPRAAEVLGRVPCSTSRRHRPAVRSSPPPA